MIASRNSSSVQTDNRTARTLRHHLQNNSLCTGQDVEIHESHLFVTRNCSVIFEKWYFVCNCY